MSKHNRDDIAHRIWLLRNERNETHKDLADAMGVSKEAVKTWENRTRQIKSDTVIKLAEHFGVSTDYLLGVNDARNPYAIHPIIEKHRTFFDHLLAAEEKSAAEGADYDLIGSMIMYILFDKNDKCIVIGNNNDLIVAEDEEDADSKTMGISSDIQCYEKAEDFFKYSYSKRIMEALENLRNYIQAKD